VPGLVRPLDDVPGGARMTLSPQQLAALEAEGEVFQRGGTHGSPASPLLCVLAAHVSWAPRGARSPRSGVKPWIGVACLTA
jgi:hypothetical protein